MEVEFMTAGTPLPPSMPLPGAVLRLPVSSTAKVMYARMLDAVLTDGIEDVNGILFIRFPIMELSAALFRSHMTVKRSLKELEESRAGCACPAGYRGAQQDICTHPKDGGNMP